jgi:mannose-6-phosphate isomerase-like protein (cupin superfamily)
MSFKCSSRVESDFVTRALYYDRDFAEEITGREIDEVCMSFTRRKACSLIPALMVAGTGISSVADQDDSLPSATFPFEDMPVQNSDHAQIRKIIKGKLATGEHIETHQTTLPPNGSPHPPHHHVHSEMWLIREGTVELTINGTTHRLGAGGVGFVHSNEEHGIKNVGTGPATYYVVAIGPGADS